LGEQQQFGITLAWLRALAVCRAARRPTGGVSPAMVVGGTLDPRSCTRQQGGGTGILGSSANNLVGNHCLIRTSGEGSVTNRCQARITVAICLAPWRELF
jgi:hypothetical protein